MALSWSGRRKLLYSLVTLSVLFVLFVVVYGTLFNNTPTCFDGALNGNERGVDCGGSCALLCMDEARAPVVLWERAFEAAPHTYTVAAYLKNNNIGAGARGVRYSFQLYDEKNLLVTERVSVLDIPPVQTVPVIYPNIDVGFRTVTHVKFAFGDKVLKWKKVAAYPALRIGNQYLSPDATTLSATLSNDAITDVRDVVVAAVLFDSEGVARGASRSVLPRISRKSSQDLTFTWPPGIKNIIRAEITILPAF